MYKGKMGIAIVLVLLNFIAFSSCVMDPGTGTHLGLIIAVGDGFASPSTKNVSVSVTMDNADPLRGIQMDICDGGNYLTCTGCETSMRTSDLNCQFNELSNGCARIMLISLAGNSIDAGTGPLFSLNYDVVDHAPSAECINLTPMGIKVSDENNDPVDATTEPGEFCIN
jgi:hypothetical protein